LEQTLKNLKATALLSLVLATSAFAYQAEKSDAKKPDTDKAKSATVPDSTTEGTVTVGGQKIAYKAIAGTITVGGTDSFDVALGLDGQFLAESGLTPPDPAKPEEAPATASMFYAAYFKKDAGPGRPLVFLYNGGPGSSTMWLHMGSFGPRRVMVPDTQHQTAAPYTIAENQYSLLDAADLVFIDAPATGFSVIKGKDKEKAFFGIDQDAHAFDRFIRRFLTKYDRWNSPKYLFGESYGTPRSAVLSNTLNNVDLNGIILLSAILSFDNSVDEPRTNPGVDQAYALALPTYAATAFYHHKLPTQPPALEPFLAEVENFALLDYEAALLAGSMLPEAKKQEVAQKLHNYTGLSVEYLLKADLRVVGGDFSKNIQDSEGLTVGRLDTRFAGPHINPLSEGAEYDPQSSAVSSAYTAAINEYLRTDMKYGKDQTYKPNAYDMTGGWDLRSHREGGANVMPDLADTMKANPKMKVLLAGGYYDLATPFFEGMYEMHHLPMPEKLQQNISYKYYEAGHMIYVNDTVLKQFHEDVSAFIHQTESGK
jgi:carboxypeptidase C (cathepsin A)